MFVRAIMLPAALIAMVGAGSASAHDERGFEGSFERGGGVSFQLSDDRDSINKIVISGINAKCRIGSGELTYSIRGEVPVLADGSFAVRSKDGARARALFRGRFLSGFEKARGVARVHGKIFEGSPRCDSGRQRFRAS